MVVLLRMEKGGWQRGLQEVTYLYIETNGYFCKVGGLVRAASSLGL